MTSGLRSWHVWSNHEDAKAQRGLEDATKNDQESLAALSYQLSAVSYQLGERRC
jgi:hypothetical protein